MSPGRLRRPERVHTGSDLQDRKVRLEEELDILRHELRRARDDLERMSGPRHALEKRAAGLMENIRLCERELKDIQRRT